MTLVYLEATCGHEYEFDLDSGVAPSETVCEEHGLVGLWAQRNEPKTAAPRPLVLDRSAA